MKNPSRNLAIIFLLSCLAVPAMPAYAAEVKQITPGMENPVKDLDTESLNIKLDNISQGGEQTLTTNLGGASLKVDESYIIINGSSPYLSGLAGYNAPPGASSPETVINGSVFDIKNGNLTSAMDTEATAAGQMNISNSFITLEGKAADDAVIYGFGLDKERGQIINLTDHTQIWTQNNLKGTILTNFGTVNLDASSSITADQGSTLNLTTGNWPGSTKTITPTQDINNKSVYNINGTIGIGNNATIQSPNPTHLEINLENGSQLNISQNGTLNLQNGNWNDGATLNARGEIMMNSPKSNVWVGQLNIGDGSNIQVKGGTTEQDWSHLSGYKGVNISGGTIILNEGAEIQAGSVNGMQISGGNITLAGSEKAGQAGSAQLRFSGKGTNQISGGTITVEAGKNGSIGAGTLTTMTGGSLIANGVLNIAGSDIGSGGTINPDAYAFNMNGGSLATGADGSLVLSNNLAMTVGENAKFSNNGNLNIGDGTAASLSFMADGQKVLTDLANGKIDLTGKDSANMASLLLNGDLDINVDRLASGTPAENGQIVINNFGNMQVSGNLSIANGSSGANALNIAQSGQIGGKQVNLPDGDFNITSGTLTATSGLNGGQVNVTQNGNLQLGKTAVNISETGGSLNANVQVDGGKMDVQTGNWKLAEGKILDVATSNGNGSLQIGGAETSNGVFAPASLDVTSGTLNSGVEGSAANGTVSTGVGVMSGGMLMANLEQLFNKPENPDDAALLDTVKSIYLDNTGAITITNVGDTTLEHLQNYRSALLANNDSTGTINWQNAVITNNPVDGEKAEQTIGNSVLANNDLAYGNDRTVNSSVEVATEASIGGKTLVLQNDAAQTADTVSVGGNNGNTLTLVGNGANSNLIATDVNGTPADNIRTVAVNENATLALGSDSVTNQAQGGKLNADVTLADQATLQTARGSFSTGAITALDNAKTRLIVKSGSSLTAPVVGSATNPIDQITNAGQLNVEKEIIANSVNNAGNLVANSMSANIITNTAGSIDLGSLALGEKADSISEITGGQANIGNLAVTGSLNIGGTDSTAPSLKVAEANLASGRLIFNHNGGGNIAESSIASFGDNKADFDVVRNTVLTVGTNVPDNWAKTALNKAGVSLSANGSVNAVLAVYSPITMKAGGGIMVGSTLVTADLPEPLMLAMKANSGISTQATGRDNLASQDQNRFILANNAVLAINAGAASNGAGAIIPSSPVDGKPNAVAEIYPGSKILIADARPESQYIVFGRNPDNNVGWDVVNAANPDLPAIADGQIITDNPLLPTLSVAQTNDGTLTIRSGAARPAALVFPSVDPQLAAVMDKAFASGQIGVSPQYTDAGARGTQFLSRALVMANNGQADKAGRAMESAGRMVALGAVPQMTLAANQAAGSAIIQRTTLAEPMGNMYSVNANGERINRAPKDYSTALWIMPLFQSTNGFSMSAGPHDYDFSGALGGIALGADYTINDAARIGLAFNIGGGYSEGSGTLNKTTNNMNFWGVGAYAGYNQENFGLMADVFYTSTFNDLKQSTPDEMDFGKLKADVNGQAISTGLRAEYKIPTQAMDIVPHAGFRYTNLVTDSYKIKSKGTVIKGDSIEQNIWQFPVGVTMTRLVELDRGWRFKPMLDLNVTPAAGDFKAKGKVRFSGTDSKAQLKTKTLDYITYGGTVGLEFSTNALSLGLSYSGEFGEETSAHGVFGTFRYEF